MFGKHFESMYEGSMIGAGAMAFAVMGYVIAKWKPERGEGGRVIGGQVRLNPALLGPILGETPEAVKKAIEYLCSPDARTSTPGEEGRRLVRLGQFDYRVVNAVKYHELRNEEQRRTQNREAQARFREKKSLLDSLSPGERARVEEAFRQGYMRRKKNGEPYKVDLLAIAKRAGATKGVSDGLMEATNEHQANDETGG